MPAAVVFILFVICLIIAIPVSIALTIASVLPGAFDPSFTASGQFVIRSMPVSYTHLTLPTKA